MHEQPPHFDHELDALTTPHSPNAGHITIVTVSRVHLTVATALRGIQHMRNAHHSQIGFVFGRRAAIGRRIILSISTEWSSWKAQGLTHRQYKCPDRPHHSQHRVWRTRHASGRAMSGTGPSNNAVLAAAGALWSVRRFPDGWATASK